MMKKPYGYWQQSALDLAKIHDPEDVNGNGYISVKRDGKVVLLHNWIWEEIKGPIPVGHQVDHENGVRTDCRLSNLRCITQLINLRNCAKQNNNSSGTTGVSRVCIKGTNYWVALWSDPVAMKQKHKYFSISKLGEDIAYKSALDHRALMLSDLVTNHGYTTRHGN